MGASLPLKNKPKKIGEETAWFNTVVTEVKIHRSMNFTADTMLHSIYISASYILMEKHTEYIIKLYKRLNLQKPDLLTGRGRRMWLSINDQTSRDLTTAFSFLICPSTNKNPYLWN